MAGGGWGCERDVSLRSARAVFSALRQEGFQPAFFDLKSPDDLPRLATQSEGNPVFLALHGRGGGEEGSVQSFLEVARIPFTGSGALSSALALDKRRAKRVVAKAGVPVLPDTEKEEYPHFEGFSEGWVIKPLDEGSSQGIQIVAPTNPWPKMGNAPLLIEPRVVGRELTVGVCGEGEKCDVFSPIEISPNSDFYDRKAKYTEGGSTYIKSPSLPEGVSAKVRSFALDAHVALGCKGATRTDFLLGRDNNLWFLELNTIPGMTELSLLPMSAQAAGISFPQLVSRIVRAA